MQCSDIAYIDDKPATRASGQSTHLDCGLHTFGRLTELIACRRSEHHARIRDRRRCSRVLQTARVSLERRLRAPITVASAADGKIGVQHVDAGAEERGEARDMNYR